MTLTIAFEVTPAQDVWNCAYWWICNNELHFYQADPIPAPEYQWLWNCEGIPATALQAWPELYQEYNQMWARLPKSIQKHYQKVHL